MLGRATVPVYVPESPNGVKEAAVGVLPRWSSLVGQIAGDALFGYLAKHPEVLQRVALVAQRAVVRRGSTQTVARVPSPELDEGATDPRDEGTAVALAPTHQPTHADDGIAGPHLDLPPEPRVECACHGVPATMRSGHFPIRRVLLNLPRDPKGWCERPAVVIDETEDGDLDVLPLTSRNHGGRFQRVHWDGNPRPESWCAPPSDAKQVHQREVRSGPIGFLCADDAIGLQQLLDPYYGCPIHPVSATTHERQR